MALVIHTVYAMSSSNNPLDTKLNIPSPSHILTDGQYVYLPSVSSLEKASFFARNVARYQLIHLGNEKKSADHHGDEKEDEEGNKSLLKHEESTSNITTAAANSNRNKETQNTDPILHPLVMASARIQTNGISELSKAINLASLVSSGEYMGLFAVVTDDITNNDNSNGANGSSGGGNSSTTGTTSAPVPSSTSNASNDDKINNQGGSNSGGRNSNTEDTDDAIMEEKELRANYTLQRKQTQFDHAAELLQSHAKQCCVVTTVQRVLDQRLLELRQHWSLAAPEHGINRKGPVRPDESVALDVEIYQRDRNEASSGISTAGMSDFGISNRIARSVPRYATIEIKDDYDVTQDITRRRKHCEVTSESPISAHPNPSPSKKRRKNQYGATSSTLLNIPSEITETKDIKKIQTYAQPFAVADPALGQSSTEFDPDNVPMLTLVYEIEKLSTGFVQSVSLDSQTHQKMDKADPAHDQLLQSLQHSLFCAKLFDFIQREIASNQTDGKRHISTSSSLAKSGQPAPIVWLSSEMEESFAPPPSLMAGRERSGSSHISTSLSSKRSGYGSSSSSSTFGVASKAPICIVHYQEGEVKVQLDSEYTLTVKLVDTKHNNDDSTVLNNDATIGNAQSDKSANSGSQSADKIHTLCRTLLLHSQFIYHDYCKKLVMMDKDDENGEQTLSQSSSAVDYGGGYGANGKTMVSGRKQSSSNNEYPPILQSCVALGSKIIFEGKARSVLRRFVHWTKSNFDESLGLHVECLWLPISIFDYHSQLAISVGEFLCIDISIYGDEISATILDDVLMSSGFGGGSRVAKFVSTEEFELYLRVTLLAHLRRTGRQS